MLFSDNGAGMTKVTHDSNHLHNNFFHIGKTCILPTESLRVVSSFRVLEGVGYGEEKTPKPYKDEEVSGWGDTVLQHRGHCQVLFFLLQYNSLVFSLT